MSGGDVNVFDIAPRASDEGDPPGTRCPMRASAR